MVKLQVREKRRVTFPVKKLLVEKISITELKEFESEASLLRNMRPHTNVVQFYGMVNKVENLCLVMEYCEGGSLSSVLRGNRRRELDNALKVKIARGIASGMLHIASEKIVHRDLAARNVLLTGSMVPKVGGTRSRRRLQEILLKEREKAKCTSLFLSFNKISSNLITLLAKSIVLMTLPILIVLKFACVTFSLRLSSSHTSRFWPKSIIRTTRFQYHSCQLWSSQMVLFFFFLLIFSLGSVRKYSPIENSAKSRTCGRMELY